MYMRLFEGNPDGPCTARNYLIKFIKFKKILFALIYYGAISVCYVNLLIVLNFIFKKKNNYRHPKLQYVLKMKR